MSNSNVTKMKLSALISKISCSQKHSVLERSSLKFHQLDFLKVSQLLFEISYLSYEFLLKSTVAKKKSNALNSIISCLYKESEAYFLGKPVWTSREMQS